MTIFKVIQKIKGELHFDRYPLERGVISAGIAYRVDISKPFFLDLYLCIEIGKYFRIKKVRELIHFKSEYTKFTEIIPYDISIIY